MPKSVLDDVLMMLRQEGLVGSEREFSTDWLGRSESYMRGLRFHNEAPSIASIAICASKLQHYGQRLAETGQHDDLSYRFLQLSDACHQQINSQCEATWLYPLEKGPASAKIGCAV
jgi:hypothetical protein